MVSTRSSSRALPNGIDPSSPSPSASPSPSPPRARARARVAAAAATATATAAAAAAASSVVVPPAVRDNESTPPRGWSHAPTRLTLLWLAISVPLVAWDTGYVLLRPWSMPGGHLHWPLWAPYALYGEVDQVYGWKAFNARNGFTSAQGALNAVESFMYLAYVWLYFSCGKALEGGPAGGVKKTLGGRAGALAIVIGFSAAVMTLSKTVLYWANEYFSGFDNIGHNPSMDLLFLWIIPNGAWLLGSGYMMFSLGGEIVDGLALASKTTKTE